jgi:hypothetical protein
VTKRGGDKTEKTGANIRPQIRDDEKTGVNILVGYKRCMLKGPGMNIEKDQRPGVE